MLYWKKDIADYHREMKGHHSDKLPDQSVVVIDNAKSHSRQTEDSKKPTTGWRKAKIQEWLAERGVSFDPSDTILILLMKFKSVFVLKKFNWGILREDILILRVSVGHSELNPIELIWAQVKSEVTRKNTNFKIKDVLVLVCEALKNVKKENWVKFSNRTARNTNNGL